MSKNKSIIPSLISKSRFLALLLILSLLFSVVGCGQTASNDDNSKAKLVFADVSWDSIQVHNRIAGFIAEKGYGYQVDYLFGETLPTLQGLGNGDIDVIMEVWVDNYPEAWNEQLQANKVKNLGSNYPDAPQGWYVPTYMIKGDAERGITAVAPNLKSVSDLPQYKDLFKDDEVPTKGRFHQSTPGWLVTKINAEKIKTYGLDEYYNVFSTGSDTALSASMVAAYEKGQPWLGYNWEPNWVMGKLDMTLLEEPPYQEELWNKNHGCAYPAAKVFIAVNSGLEKKAPEMIDFLTKYETTLEQNNQALAYMSDNNGNKDTTAIWFLKTYPETWKKWVPEDIAVKVETALVEVK